MESSSEYFVNSLFKLSETPSSAIKKKDFWHQPMLRNSKMSMSIKYYIKQEMILIYCDI